MASTLGPKFDGLPNGKFKLLSVLKWKHPDGAAQMTIDDIATIVAWASEDSTYATYIKSLVRGMDAQQKGEAEIDVWYTLASASA